MVFNLQRLFVAESNGGIAQRGGRHVGVITVVLKDGVATHRRVACENSGRLLPTAHSNKGEQAAHCNGQSNRSQARPPRLQLPAW